MCTRRLDKKNQTALDALGAEGKARLRSCGGPHAAGWQVAAPAAARERHEDEAFAFAEQRTGEVEVLEGARRALRAKRVTVLEFEYSGRGYWAAGADGRTLGATLGAGILGMGEASSLACCCCVGALGAAVDGAALGALLLAAMAPGRCGGGPVPPWPASPTLTHTPRARLASRTSSGLSAPSAATRHTPRS